MNDTELDEMLNQWRAPEVPVRLRDSIKLPPPQRKGRFAWPSWHLSKGLLAGAVAGTAICFIGIAAAFPQVLTPTPRFNLISEILSHNDDGTTIVMEQRASTARTGEEIMLQRNFPDNWMMSLHERLIDTVHLLLGISMQPTQPPLSMASDCSIPTMSTLGHETVLKYRTIVQRETDQDGSRYTEWRAPDLDCIVMKYIAEKPADSGEFHITREKRPLVVRINHTQ